MILEKLIALAVFIFWAVPTLLVIRRILFWQRMGQGRHARRIRMTASVLLSISVIAGMATQIYLLWKMGLAGVGTVLPLHLCSFMGIMTPFMLLTPSVGLLEFALYLGVPGAFAALVFPAVMPSPWPVPMYGAFMSFHAIVVLAPFLRMTDGTRPMPGSMGRVFLWGNMLLIFVMCVNGVLQTNYFFLRTAPTGTPLYPLQKLGQAAYVAALEAAALVLIKFETVAYRRILKHKWVRRMATGKP